MAIVWTFSAVIGAPQKAGERLGNDLFNLDEKTKTASATAYALPAKAQGALRRCSAAGHSAKAYVTGCKAPIVVCHKCRMPCFVQTGAPCKGQGAARRRPFQSGRKNKSR